MLSVVYTIGFVGPVYAPSVIGMSVRATYVPAVDKRRMSVIAVVA